MKKLAIVTCGTSDMSFAMGTMLLNFKSKTKIEQYDTYLFSDSKMKAKDKLIFEQKLGCTVIEYDCPINLLKTNNKYLRYFSPIIFSKFETLKLLERYDQVLYLDYDIVILENIDDLFKIVNGFAFLDNDRSIKDTLLEEIPEYDLDKKCLAAGTFILNSKDLNHSKIKGMYKFCYKTLSKYENKLMYPEQNVFDFMIQKFSLKIKRLDSNIFALHPRDFNQDSKPRILHSYGKKKFWEKYYSEYWLSNYVNWKRLGGSRFSPINKLLKMINRKLAL